MENELEAKINSHCQHSDTSSINRPTIAVVITTATASKPPSTNYGHSSSLAKMKNAKGKNIHKQSAYVPHLGVISIYSVYRPVFDDTAK